MAHVGFRDEGLGAWGVRCDGVGDGMQGSGFGLGMMGCEEGEEEDGLAEEEEGCECGPGGDCEREGVHDWCDLGMGCRLTFSALLLGLGFGLGGVCRWDFIYVHYLGCLPDRPRGSDRWRVQQLNSRRDCYMGIPRVGSLLQT